jgi:transposase
MAGRKGPGSAPGPRPKRVRLKGYVRRELEVMARSYHGPARLVLRAKAILALTEDPCVTRVARRLGLSRKSVTRWRDRFLGEGVNGLKDRPQPPRPMKLDAVGRCELIALACAKPAEVGVPFRQVWTYEALRQAFLERQPGRSVSRSTVIRTLNAGELRPHRVRQWLHSPDPEFRRKVTEIAELYRNPPPGSTVLCVDEKTGIQALGRKHPFTRPAPGRTGRFEFEYIRNGTRKLLAAFNPHRGEVYGEVRPTRTGADLVEFMEEVARRYPEGDVHIVWDNLNIHFDGQEARWTQFNERHGHRFHLHYTPLHASWVNQVECWFGVLQRRVIRLNAFNSREELDAALLSFITYWNRCEMKPFRWTFRGYPRQIEQEAA